MKDREAWRAAVHGVTKGQIQFSNRTTTKDSCRGGLNRRAGRITGWAHMSLRLILNQLAPLPSGFFIQFGLLHITVLIRF